MLKLKTRNRGNDRQWGSSDLQMQSEEYTICDDLGGFGYEIQQETQKWNRDFN